MPLLVLSPDLLFLITTARTVNHHNNEENNLSGYAHVLRGYDCLGS